MELQLYKTALEIAFISFVFCNILTQPNQLLYKWSLFLYWLNRKEMQWLSNPLGYCDKCFSGQVALWFYIFTVGKIEFSLVVFICITISFTIILKYLWTKTQQ